MIQRTITVFMNELYSKQPRKTYSTNRTVVYRIDDTWSLDIIDLTDYDTEDINVF